MVAFAVGDVVLIPFPYSDLSTAKLRPAVILASAGHNDWICAQITSNAYSDPNVIALDGNAFHVGSLQRNSYIRPAKLFTADEVIFRRRAGQLKRPIIQNIRKQVAEIFLGKPSRS